MAVGVGLAVAATSGAGCIPDWDVYDPRLGGTTTSGTGGTGGGGTGGTGGSGGAGGSGGGVPTVCEPGTSIPCYTGLAGTPGVGECGAGTKTCDAQGLAYGPCEGEVTPVAETCATPGDEDCDGQANEEGDQCSCEPGMTMPCYTGAAGTIDKGICKGGTQTCNAEGTGFDACMDEVVPASESCATMADEDCTGVSNEHCAAWTKSFGSNGDQFAAGVAVDNAGAVIVVGRFINTINFGGGVLVSQGGNDAFIAKFTSAGAYVWQKSFGDLAEQSATSVAVDTAGNVYVAGTFEGTITVDAAAMATHTSAGLNDIFVVKYSPQGAYIGSESFGDAEAQSGLGIAVDAASNILLAGNMKGSVSFGGATLTAGASTNGFVAKLDAMGAHVWSKLIGTAGTTSAQSIAVDAGNNVVVGGYFTQQINVGTGVVQSKGSNDVFVAKLSPAGTGLWAKGAGGAMNQEAYSVAVGPSGNVAVHGEHEGSLDFGCGLPVMSAGLDDVFVAMLDAVSGDCIWSLGFGNSLDQKPGGVAAGAGDDVVVIGSFDGTMNFGGLPVTASGADDIFLARLDGATGSHEWSRRFGAVSDQDGRAVDIGAMGSVVFVGDYGGTVNYGSGNVTSVEGKDIVIVSIPP